MKTFQYIALFCSIFCFSVHSAESASTPLSGVTSGDVKAARSQNAKTISLSTYGDLNIVFYYKTLCSLMKGVKEDSTAAQQKTFLANFPDVMKEIAKLKELQSSVQQEGMGQILSCLEDMYMYLIMGFGHKVFNTQNGKEENIPGFFQKNNVLQKKLQDNLNALQSQKANPMQAIQALQDLSNEKISFMSGGTLEPLEKLDGKGKDLNTALDVFEKSKDRKDFQKILSIVNNKANMNVLKKSLSQNPKAWYELMKKISNAFGLNTYYVKPKLTDAEKEMLKSQRMPFIYESGEYQKAEEAGKLLEFMQKPMSTDTSHSAQQGAPHGSAAQSLGNQTPSAVMQK